MLTSGVLVDWNVGKGGIDTGDLLRLPDEVLKKIAIVLGEQ